MNISVCLAAYNGSNYIIEQINSILPQLEENDELIISDNLSSDNTVELIKNSYTDQRIKLLSCSTIGVVANFQNSILNSKNSIICLCDQDDIWLPGRLDSIRVAHIKYDLVIVNAFVGDINSITIYDNLIYPPSFFSTIFKNRILGCSMSFNRFVLDAALPFPKHIAMHDWWIYLIGIIFFKVTIVITPLFIYRRHANNVSSTLSASRNSLFKRLFMRMNLIFFLILYSIEIINSRSK